jgi:hypothetical protein
MLHDEKEFREALSAVLTSTTFERAERLKKFFSFICDLVLAGKDRSFGKPPPTSSSTRFAAAGKPL